MSQWPLDYNNRKWRRRRAVQLKVEPLCRICQAQGRIEPAVEVDHIKPHRGDANEFFCGEIQSLCRKCHRAKTIDEQRQKRGRWAKGWAVGVDGMPVSRDHPAWD